MKQDYRSSLRLTPELHHQMKVAAAIERRRLCQVVEEALNAYLKAKHPAVKRMKVP